MKCEALFSKTKQIQISITKFLSVNVLINALKVNEIWMVTYDEVVPSDKSCLDNLLHLLWKKIHVYVWAAKWNKGPYGFPVFGSSNVHVQSPIWATDMHFLPEATSRFLLHVCKQQRLWWDWAYWVGLYMLWLCQMTGYQVNIFSYFSMKTYVLGSH